MVSLASRGSRPPLRRARASSPTISARRGCSAISRRSGSTSSATDARPASATAVRFRSRSARRSSSTTSSSRACLSGNRNFEGRIHPDVKANYLASPPLVVAYAIAGTVDIDLTSEPIGVDRDGRDVFLRDIWPTEQEIDELLATCVTREQFESQYASVFEGSDEWKAIATSGGQMYGWDAESTYIQNPPFFASMPKDAPPIRSIEAARCLVKVGDSVTTDHISPAGSIKKDSPAGK